MQPVYWLATNCIAGAEAGNQKKASALFRWKKEKMGRMWYILACHWEKQEGDKVLGLATVTFRLRMDIQLDLLIIIVTCYIQHYICYIEATGHNNLEISIKYDTIHDFRMINIDCSIRACCLQIVG